MTKKEPPKPTFKERIVGVVSSAARATKRALKEAAQLDFFARFRSAPGEQEISFPIDMGHDTVWATQAQMASLFGIDQSVVAKHIRNIFNNNELEEGEATHAKFALVQNEGGREVSREISHYSLDVILTVGYRVSGTRANEFRKWANNVLKGYIEDGYALNGARLNADPAALRRLAREVRAIRTSEKNLYDQVRETFKVCSIDYDANSEEARKFFAHCQDRFHYAVSDHTSAQIILQRADGSKPFMGMTALGNKAPTFADAKVAKNYLSDRELRSLEILGEQWLLYAEGMAQREKTVSMARLVKKLDELISVNEYTTFPGYHAIGALRPAADAHAKRQFEIYKTKSLGE